MDHEALVTFSYQAPTLDITTVELLGSWDNFTHPYRMQPDRRRAKGAWTGCFQFKNIIYDGCKTGFSSPRDGALLQGGTYWYFFRLNDNVEAVSDEEVVARSCPLLPGQALNMLEVPLDVSDHESEDDSSVESRASHVGYTLNPTSKFEPLNPWPMEVEQVPRTKNWDSSSLKSSIALADQPQARASVKMVQKNDRSRIHLFSHIFTHQHHATKR